MAADTARLLALLLAATAGAAGAQNQPPPDVKRICVPAEDGRTWECGTVDNPPPERGLPQRAEAPSSSAPPPFFLANPDAPTEPEVNALPEQAPAQVEPAAPEPVAEAPVESAPDTSVAETAADPAASEPGSETGAATTPVAPDAAAASSAAPEPLEPLPEPPSEPASEAATDADAAAAVGETPAEPVTDAAEPEPVAETPAAESSTDTIAAAPAEPMAESPAESAAATPAAPIGDSGTAALEPGRVPQDGNAFLGLNAAHHTVQLARAPSPDGFPQLAWSLGLAPESTYAVPFDLGGTTTWLLLWSDFPDLASARAAVTALARQASIAGAVPRRVGPLQNELRARAAR